MFRNTFVKSGFALLPVGIAALIIHGCGSTDESFSPTTPMEDSSANESAPAPASPPQKVGSQVVEEVIVTAQQKSDKPVSVTERIRQKKAEKERLAKAEQRRQASAEKKQIGERAAVLEEESFIIDDSITYQPVDPTMIFKNYGVNPTITTQTENTSTFSIDVDTASYNVAKGFLDQRRLPDANGIRVEEFVNALDYGYKAPVDDVFSIQAEAFPSPYRQGFHVLHLGVKAKDVSSEVAVNSNITLLIDVSGSMGSGNRLELLKDSLEMLVNQLKPNDTVSMVLYTDDARLHLEATEVRYKQQIRNAIYQLRPEGSTNIEAGIKLAYRMANKSFDPSRNNRIILCSDGVGNVGNTSANAMMANISDAAKKGIYLNSIGVGMGNYNDVVLEKLATLGQGHYGYLNTLTDAKRLLVENLNASLQTVARDVRVQVEFDPLFVQSYRLVGYENRGMANEDFNNAAKDAGEVGAGHSVTAIYEIKFREGTPKQSFGAFRINYKPLDQEKLIKIEKALPASIVANTQERATANTQLSYISAAFAEKLRASYWSRTYSYHELESWLAPLVNKVANPSDAKELQHYIHLASQLDSRNDQYSYIVPLDKMDFDHVPVLSN